ncbi:Cyclic di-GMP phosphodiesterase response regulator RpfG [Anaerolineales bacterium]|nr:Cyclic di-GMP phosphodiesterase response regulator RpfG [Anaerolineales bacterium]
MMAEEIINILLIEDEDPHAELIQRAFEGEDGKFEIQRAKSLVEARAKMLVREPSLIIADWRLPDGESMELLPNRHDPLATPIILMTSYGNERIAVEALKSGALDYVVKSPESMLDMPHIAERAVAQWVARAERIRMQEALRESESQFRLLAENASDMIARVAIDGKMLYVSPACKTILGYTPEELTGRIIFDLVHEKDRAFIESVFKGNGHEVTNIVTYEAKHKGGHYVWLESSARAVLDSKINSVVEIQTASRDITERKKAGKALQEAHDDLREAYERTIEGWVRALDLRDRETEGHTQRVTELTVKVAEKVGFSGEELVHIRRGALLHDMGKMAIPDEILQKPGPLNEVEWGKMRQHPKYAYDMLYPIAYLRPALVIPFCHHERWDGSGYPRGLKGEDIPLAARLFSIVDVWDALRSDRPYRKKVPTEEVINYLREKSGCLFDPKLVEIFLTMMESQ